TLSVSTISASWPIWRRRGTKPAITPKQPPMRARLYALPPTTPVTGLWKRRALRQHRIGARCAARWRQRRSRAPPVDRGWHQRVAATEFVRPRLEVGRRINGARRYGRGAFLYRSLSQVLD